MRATLLRVAPFAVILTTLGLAAVALGTPPSGQHPSTPVVATLGDKAQVNTDRIKLQTKDPTDIATFTVTCDPGGYSGWHTHPGVLFVLVQSGAVVREVGCSSRTYHAGEAFIESDKQPSGQVRNASSLDPAVLYVTQVVPHGSARREESQPPTC
jgi:quercetin dioxygenase-like cupin family protein